MSRRAMKLSVRIQSFKDELLSFVENLSDDDWKKKCAWDEWAVGVTARHLGAGHFAIFGMIGKMIRGEQLPKLTMDQINESANRDAREYLNCTKPEALDLIRKNGAELIEFVARLTNDELDRKSRLPALGGDISTEQFIERVLFQSGGEHFGNMKRAVSG